MSNIGSRIKEELEAMLPPTIFFFVALHIVALIRSLMLKQSGIQLGTTVSVAVASLILGKAVLIADMLPIINRYPEKPLIYNVVWKTIIYVLMSLLIHYGENLFEHWRQTESVAAANRELLAKFVWPHFLAVQILLVVMVFSYCVLRELVRVIGRQQFIDMFFRHPMPQQ